MDDNPFSPTDRFAVSLDDVPGESQREHEGDVRLTAEERRMLMGEFGSAKSKALRFVIQYAQALGARQLVQIRKAQIFIGAHHYLRTIDSEDIDEVISEMYLNTSEKVVLDSLGCFTQSDAMPLDPIRWKKLGIEESQVHLDQRFRDRFHDAGAVEGGSCASYLIGFVPVMGEHYVSTESHALLFMNSVWGARANADSIEASICSAVCGRTPLWGNHIAEQRLGTHVINVSAEPLTVHDWDMLGFAIGKRLPANAVPVVVGDFDPPDVERLKSFFASMATSGSVEMCHIVGLTPEAPTLSAALGGREPIASTAVGAADLQSARAEVCAHGRGPVQFVSLGCPHYSLSQIQYVATQLVGRRIHPSVRLQIWTAGQTRQSAQQSGLVKTIEKAGGDVFIGTCPLVSETVPDVAAMAFDSLKQAKYVSLTTSAKVYAGSVDECLDAAVTGVWKGLNA
jgi:hypothetical protein